MNIFKILPVSLMVSLTFFLGCGGGGGGTSSNKHPQQPRGPQQPLPGFTYRPPFITIPPNHPGLTSVITTAANNHGVAVFPHTRIRSQNNDVFVLLMKRSGNQLWGTPGGRLGDNVNGVVQPENYGQAGARELYEESIKAYGSDHVRNLRGNRAYITSDDLLKSHFSVVQGAAGDVHILFFARVPFVEPSDFQTRMAREADSKFREHTDFAWVRLRELKQQLDIKLATPGWRNGGYRNPAGHIHLNRLGGGAQVTLWPRTVRAMVEPSALALIDQLAR